MTAFAAARPIHPGRDLSWRLRFLRAVLLGMCLWGIVVELHHIPEIPYKAMAAVAGDEVRSLLEPVGERALKGLPLPVTWFALDTCATPLSQA